MQVPCPEHQVLSQCQTAKGWERHLIMFGKVVTDVTVQAVGAGAIVTDSQVPWSVGCATTTEWGMSEFGLVSSGAQRKEARRGSSSGRDWNFKNICLTGDVKGSQAGRSLGRGRKGEK